MNSGVGAGRILWEDGALRAAMRGAAEGLGLELPEADEKSRRLAEYVDGESGRRVMVSPPDSGRRAFQVRLHGNRAPLAFGASSDLAKVVTATAAWIGGAGLEETKARASFVRYRPWALTHEQKPFGKVELEWLIKLDRVHTPPYNRHPRAHAVLAAAYAQPVLRGLMPVNSHYNLWFSTAIEEPWRSKVGYVLSPYEGGVYGSDAGLYEVWKAGEVVARTETAEEAVALVVAGLPEGIGPAV
ncbi:DUF6193 family natural product biosynthesis protein [Streptomyces sp. NRRL WC-3742]|uniref:DUF6193 family natural product biosynthesis protein n=1 Tax=Streptomyces sp. NRRL WC-3742 TaxID=1463934 RepID=UPI00131B4B93|nr:DUF6193 family natural product biosynthesis protein [Streptomyces sp. NRRL WC-3742]